MRITDCIVLLAACAVGYLLVFGAKPLQPHYQIAVLFSVLLQLIVFNAYSLYRTWRGVDYAQEFTAVLIAWTTVFAILVFLAVITKTSEKFSRAWLLMWFSFGGISMLLMRYILRRLLQSLRSKGFNLRHIAIIGAGGVGKHVFESIQGSPESGFNICGYFSDDEVQVEQAKGLRRGAVIDALDFVTSRHVDQVWIAMPLAEADQIDTLVNLLSEHTLDIRLVPDIFGFRLINHSVSTVAGMPVVNLSVTPMDGVNRWIKLMEDKVVSFLVLILMSPFFLIIAAMVKLSSPGPVLYKQDRLSWNGNCFTMYKFRTMPVGAEESTGAKWATRDEQRATSFGKLLRRTSLDELPQFWNVLTGHMSIVGPRPERPVFVEQFKDEIPSYMRKHMVKAGITGWAQVNGWRGNTDLHKRIEHDLYYIDNWSLWLDIRIMMLTVVKGFFNKNAY
ncbi:MAG: undecaprenyl-phosphate glucose phosphotransferase [Halioglobus sp.]